MITDDKTIKINDDDIKLIKPVSIGNTGLMYLVVDKNEKEFFFKPAQNKNGEKREYRAYIQEAAAKLQSIISPETSVQCNIATINGMFGAIQEKIDIKSNSINMEELYSDQNLKNIIGEYVVDYCLCNYDSHERNFIIDKDNRIKGIDKEQAFRYIDEENSDILTMNNNYNEQYRRKSSNLCTNF